MKRGEEWFLREDWTPYYRWLEPILFAPGRWAVVPDAPGAPSQLNDSLLNEWPFGQRGSPLYHMDAPVERLLRLCEKWDRVSMGWVGRMIVGKDGKMKPDPKEKRVGCDAYRWKMDEIARALGNHWPVIHMMRGTSVAFDYPFISADSTSLAQNGHRYNIDMDQVDLWGNPPADPWAGRQAYADRLEGRRHEEREALYVRAAA